MNREIDAMSAGLQALCFFSEVKRGESKGSVPHLSVKLHVCPSLKRWAEIEKKKKSQNI